MTSKLQLNTGVGDQNLSPLCKEYEPSLQDFTVVQPQHHQSSLKFSASYQYLSQKVLLHHLYEEQLVILQTHQWQKTGSMKGISPLNKTLSCRGIASGCFLLSSCSTLSERCRTPDAEVSPSKLIAAFTLPARISSTKVREKCSGDLWFHHRLQSRLNCSAFFRNHQKPIK